MIETSIPLFAIAFIALAIYLPAAYVKTLFTKDLQASRWRAAIQVKHPVDVGESKPLFNDEFLSSSNWWTSQNLFQIERRAFFSKNWLFVTHVSRFEKAGDYRTFEIAGFSFILILGKDKQLRAFHNVCRHRAYAITKKECGSSTVLGCRYHGWSYDTKGHLIKAPEFDVVEGFEKSLNGLWEIKTVVRESMVFVNFDAGEKVKQIEVNGLELAVKRRGSDVVKCIGEWKTDCTFNWKLAVAEMFQGEFGSCPRQSFLPLWFKPPQNFLRICHTTITRQQVSGNLLTIRILPTSPTKSIIECLLFGNESPASAEREIRETKKEIQKEIQRLVSLQQKIVKKGLSFSTPDHTNDILLLLKEHMEAEKALGKDIHPTARIKSFTMKGREDDDLCLELEKDSQSTESICQINNNGLLDW